MTSLQKALALASLVALIAPSSATATANQPDPFARGVMMRDSSHVADAPPAEVDALSEMRQGSASLSTLLSGMNSLLSKSFRDQGFQVVGTAKSPWVDGQPAGLPLVARMWDFTEDAGSDVVAAWADEQGSHLRMLEGRTGQPWLNLDLDADVSLIAIPDPYSCVNLMTVEIDIDDRGNYTNNGEWHQIELQQTIKRRNSCLSTSAWDQITRTGRIYTQSRSGANPYTKIAAVHDLITDIQFMAPREGDWFRDGSLAVMTVAGGNAAAWDLPELSQVRVGASSYQFTLHLWDETWGYDEGMIRFPAANNVTVIDMVDLKGQGAENFALVRRDSQLEMWQFGLTFFSPASIPGTPMWSNRFARSARAVGGTTLDPASLGQTPSADVLSETWPEITKLDGATGVAEWSAKDGLLIETKDLNSDGNNEIIRYWNYIDSDYGTTSVIDGSTGKDLWSKKLTGSCCIGWFAFGGPATTSSGQVRWIMWQRGGWGGFEQGVRAYDIADGSLVWEIGGRMTAVLAQGDPWRELPDMIAVMLSDDGRFTGLQMHNAANGKRKWSPGWPDQWDSVLVPFKLADVDDDGEQDLLRIFSKDDAYWLEMTSNSLPGWTLPLS